MIQSWWADLSQIPWVVTLLRTLLYFTLAYLLHRLARRISRSAVRISKLAKESRRPSPERQQTLQSLVASAISVAAFLLAFLFSVGQFVDSSTLLWVVGLLSAGIGMSARPMISDLFAGVGFLFEDTYAVGEKVEVLDIEGVIEAVNLTTTWMRAPTGELYIIPNGEIRTVRNFSRGRFSPLSITLKMSSADLGEALPILEALGNEAISLLPNLLEPWQVISPSGLIGQQTELELVARTRFGKAAEMRPRLSALVQERLEQAGITLVN